MTEEATPAATAKRPTIVSRIVELARELPENEARERGKAIAAEATEKARDSDDAPEEPLGRQTRLLGWYVPKASREEPGKVVLHGYNIACYAHATAESLERAGHPLASTHRDALCATVAYAVLRHEQFHAFTDLQRWQAIAPYDREIEEALATAWEWRHARLAIAGEVEGPELPAAIGEAALADWFYRITATGYRDWRDYSEAGDFLFEIGRYTHLGQSVSGTSALIGLMRSAAGTSNYAIVLPASVAASCSPFEEKAWHAVGDVWDDTLAQRAIEISSGRPATAKYELIQDARHDHVVSLRRVRALRAFGNVKAGELGGWIQSENNLSHDGDCWVAGEARVHGDARVFHNARIEDNAEVREHASVCGVARVRDETSVSGHARIAGATDLIGRSHVGGHAKMGWDGNALRDISTDIAYICGAEEGCPEKPRTVITRVALSAGMLLPVNVKDVVSLERLPRFRLDFEGTERRGSINLVQLPGPECIVEITAMRKDETPSAFRERVNEFTHSVATVTEFRRAYDDHAVIRIRPL